MEELKLFYTSIKFDNYKAEYTIKRKTKEEATAYFRKVTGNPTVIAHEKKD